MQLRIFLMILFSCLEFSCLWASEKLTLKQEVVAGYSKQKYKCTVEGFYGEIVKLKTVDAQKERVFYLLDKEIAGDYKSPVSPVSKEEADKVNSILVNSYVEFQHPNGEWYIGEVKEKYGVYLKVQGGEKEWAAVWVASEQYEATLKIRNTITLKNYRHKAVGSISDDGIIRNKEGVVIGKVYSNGKIFNAKGELVGKVNANGAIEKASGKDIAVNLDFCNGILFLNENKKPYLVMRIKNAALYHYDHPDVVELFFDADELKGHMRICAGVFFLLKDHF